ncbi:hypothetical protein VDP97_11370 [Xanthomonas campestris pv. campestris]|uniref:Exported protein n=1 Tax=Xanthomonas campestris pv. campestris (strain B100) TaxID=509169 RepID=B0RMY5_XANCB|nr:hypothetical protein [Xanthomonas campestris]MCC3255785.1 hypothetical protein [Xanthomonas campestris pv. armoraciae]MCC5076627.1 hypothetical protein [Xanthomonas campestris pv. campestris]MDM7594747.1 hypothetical protein [Xanthomonas campestris pv. campestris]MDM7599827.1 hypothetical protein [Xanthomonas campestris pv. campestris]MDM7603078.1 hypothetical protein [Xanthomonas campestris pv. campestris]
MALSHFSFRRLPALRNALLPGLLAVSACSAGESAPAATPPVTSTASASAPAATRAPASSGASLNDRLATLLQASGVQCADANMAKGCTAGNVDAGDFYDVELSPACDDAGLFAGVAQASGVDVLDAVPTTGSSVVARARLAQGQLVCIQAIGRAGQNPLYYYVIAIPADSVAGCKNNPACRTYGDRPIQRSKSATGGSCHAAAPGQYVGDCAQGWVGADALDVFSNGI